MTKAGRLLALAAALALFVFSVWMYTRTADWVAIVFALGSAAYAIFFFTGGPGDRS
ncbi:MAG: hypothetical protein KDI10_19145 [Halioglobus sp.]|nr:hypothetical protein [Halioglobus sp.]